MGYIARMAGKMAARFELEAPIKRGIVDTENSFLDFDSINAGIQNLPLDEDEKRMIRNGKRRKVPIPREETLQMIKEQREIYADFILESRLRLLAQGVSREQILLWESDPEGRSSWDIYAATPEGKAEVTLQRKMDDEHYRRWRKQNPDSEDVPF